MVDEMESGKTPDDESGDLTTGDSGNDSADD
jgi:hypothetical protein